MEQEVGLHVNELESVFAQIKNGKDGADAKLYNAYVPLIEACADKYDMDQTQVNDIYNETFTCVYNAVLKGVVPAVNFTMCFENMLRTRCYKYCEKHNEQFNSSLLFKSYVKNSSINEQSSHQRERRRLVADQSLIFVTQVLSELDDNQEFAEGNGLNEEKVLMIRDFYGLNQERTRFSVMQLAKKYNVTESRVQAVLIVGLKKLRDMKEFASIKQ